MPAGVLVVVIAQLAKIVALAKTVHRTGANVPFATIMMLKKQQNPNTRNHLLQILHEKAPSKGLFKYKISFSDNQRHQPIYGLKFSLPLYCFIPSASV